TMGVGGGGRAIALLGSHPASVWSAVFSPDGSHFLPASQDGTARIFDLHFLDMPLPNIVMEICARRLGGISALTADEQRRLGERDIDVCAGLRSSSSPRDVPEQAD